MPDEFDEGALNNGDAPPADADSGQVDDQAAQNEGTDQQADEAGQSQQDASGDDVALVDANAAGDADPREQSIPREKWEADKTKLTAEAETHRKEAEGLRQQNELIKKAAAAGYADNTALYQQHDAWAKANNFGSIENYRQLQAYEQELDARTGLDAESKQDLLDARLERLQSAEMNRQTRDMIKQHQGTVLDQTIAKNKAQFEAAGVTAEQWKAIEAQCRKLGHVQAVEDTLRTFADVFGATVKTVKQTAVTEHVSRKANASNGAPAPGGRGGAPAAAAQQNQKTPQQIKGTLLSDLLGLRDMGYV